MPWTDLTAAIGVDRPIRASTHLGMFLNFAALANGDADAPRVRVPQALRTDETNASLVLKPDGAGGVRWAGASVANGSVGRSQLRTGQGTVSLSTSGPPQTAVLPGGEYGFWPSVRSLDAGGNDLVEIQVFLGNRFMIPTSHQSIIAVGGAPGFPSIRARIQARQRYVQSSPPYDLGHGPVPLFVFAMLDPDDQVVAAWAAEDPPWANNGPTDIGVDFVGPDGTGYQWLPGTRARRRELDAERAQHAVALGEALDADHGRQLLEVLGKLDAQALDCARPVDQTLKQADRELIPHPFPDVPDGCRVVLLEPTATQALADLHADGEDVAALCGTEVQIDAVLEDGPVPVVRFHC